jgi:hypothetical protein
MAASKSTLGTGANSPSSLKKRGQKLSKKGLTETHGAEEAQRIINERVAKSRATRRKNVEVTNTLSEMILEADAKTGKSFLVEWFKEFLNEAKKHPNSRASAFIAESVGLNKDFFDRADKWLQQAQEKDKDFEYWRLVKNLTPAQQAALPHKGQHLLLNYAGRGWGKTAFNAALMLYYAAFLHYPVLYLNKSFTSAYQQIWGALHEFMEKAMITPSKSDKTTGYLEFAANGIGTGSIRVAGHDNKSASDSWRGYEFALLIMDECFYHRANIRYLVEDVIEPRMGKFPERLIVASCSPPRSKVKYFELMRETWTTIKGTMRDNPHMRNSWALFDEKVKQNTNTARREYAGLWEVDEESLIWHPCAWSEPSHINHICIGLDWGFDSTNIVIVGSDSVGKKSWVLDELKEPSLMVSEQIAVIQEKYALAKKIAADYGVTKHISIQCDTNEKPVAQELAIVHKLPIETAFNKQNKKFSIRKLDDWFRTGKLFVKEDLHCYEECNAAVWKRDKESEAIIDEVDDDVFHPQIMDALRYCMDRVWFDLGV